MTSRQDLIERYKEAMRKRRWKQAGEIYRDLRATTTRAIKRELRNERKAA